MSKNKYGALSAVFTRSITMIRFERYLLCHAKLIKRSDLHDLGLDRERLLHF